MKSVIFAVCAMVGTACTTGESDEQRLHDLLPCEGWGSADAVWQCERACTPQPSEGSGATCNVTEIDQNGSAHESYCGYITTDTGVRGCCQPAGFDGPVRFLECH